MSSVSGWCAPGPLGKPNHDGCMWKPCACYCHTNEESEA